MSILSSTNTGKQSVIISDETLNNRGYSCQKCLYGNYYKKANILIHSQLFPTFNKIGYVFYVLVSDKRYIRKTLKNRKYNLIDVYEIRLENTKQLEMIEDYYNNNETIYTLDDIIKYNIEHNYHIYKEPDNTKNIL
jgi:hypothetical protein